MVQKLLIGPEVQEVQKAPFRGALDLGRTLLDCSEVQEWFLDFLDLQTPTL